MLEELRIFLKAPYALTLRESNDSFKVKLKSVLRVYVLCMAFLVGSAILIAITDTILFEIMNLSLIKAIHLNREKFNNYFGKQAWVYIALVAPLMEELIFRLPLSGNKNQFLFGVSFMVFYFSGNTLTNLEDFTFARVSISVLIYILLFMLLTKESFQKLRKKYFNVLCWGLIVFFSWMHINNFRPIHWGIIYVYPIYVLPQLFYGIGLSFLMVKYRNVLWPLLLHIFINSVGVLLHLF